MHYIIIMYKYAIYKYSAHYNIIIIMSMSSVRDFLYLKVYNMYFLRI